MAAATRSTWCVLQLALMFAALSTIADAQQAVTVRGASGCRGCEVVVTAGVRLGAESGPGIIEHLETRAVEDSRGRFILKANYPTSLQLFAPDGRYLRSIERAGGGPGEFRGIGSIALLPSDSLVVFDWGSRRYSLLSDNYEYLASGPLPMTPELSTLALPSGLFVFNATVNTPQERGQPLHAINRRGTRERSFGATHGAFRPDVPYFLSRAITSSRAGLVWSAVATEYRLDLFDAATGARKRTVIREAPWFPPRMRAEPAGQPPSLEPRPFIYDVREDAVGRLWVLIAVADPEWRAAVRAPSPSQPHGTVLDEQQYLDTIIEVLDVQTGRLLASRRLPQRITHFVADNRIGTVIEDDDGTPRLHTWTVALRVP